MVQAGKKGATANPADPHILVGGIVTEEVLIESLDSKKRELGGAFLIPVKPTSISTYGGGSIHLKPDYRTYIECFSVFT